VSVTGALGNIEFPMRGARRYLGGDVCHHEIEQAVIHRQDAETKGENLRLSFFASGRQRV
jgi:hypothetical protein